MTIDYETVSKTAINASEVAVIDKYGFELKGEQSDFVLIDPLVRRAKRSKGGKHIGTNLTSLLERAVTERRALKVLPLSVGQEVAPAADGDTGEPPAADALILSAPDARTRDESRACNDDAPIDEHRATRAQNAPESTPASTFAPPEPDAHVSKRLTGPLLKHGYKRQKERSPDGYFVYSRGDEVIHVGSGKNERAYLMGWRLAGAEQHGYGGPDLEKYLAGC